jgi:hypothetical protein
MTPTPPAFLPGQPPVLGILALEAAMLVIVFALIVLIESTVMQLLGWGDRRRSVKGALLMNLLSVIVTLIFLGLAPRWGISGLLLSGLASVLLEWLVLQRLEPGRGRYNLLVALAANLASYLLLLLPAFLMAG